MTTTEERETAVFAGGCFWGVEHLMQNAPGVLDVSTGYTGGHKDNPSYEDVCAGDTGHIEAVQIVFDKTKTSYETLAKLFFEIHNPCQSDGQGPDIGEQYLSKIFYSTEEQKKTALALIDILKQKGLAVATEVLPAAKFWPAEEYHQKYYQKKGALPYCHARVKRFDI